MPPFAKAQLVLLELAAAAVLGGLTTHTFWRWVGVAGGGVLLALAILPWRRRWLYQTVVSWAGLVRRRRAGRGLRQSEAGLAGVLGPYEIELAPGGSTGPDLGVVRTGSTWCLPLALGLDDVLNDDAPVPLDVLTGLLRVEDVPVSSVRLVTLTTPARAHPQAPAGPAAPMTQLAARYLLLTVDSRRARDAIAARGGTRAAVHQILRRCAVTAERVLPAVGVGVRRLDEAGVSTLFSAWMGPADPGGDPGAPRHSRPRALESWRDVRAAGTWSTVFAVSGAGDDVADRVARLAAAAPTPVVATCLLLEPSPRGRGPARASLLVRLSAPESARRADAAASLGLVARAFDLVLQRVEGEQAHLLRATSPLGVVPGEA